MKNAICAAVGLIGGGIAAALGGWDLAVKSLLALAAADFFSGWLVAAVFHKSPKTDTGAYASRVGLKGLVRKAMMFVFVCIGNMMDNMMGVAYLRDAITIGFVVNEILSICENAGLMGLPLPKPLIAALDVLADKADVVSGADESDGIAAEDLTDDQLRAVFQQVGLSRTYTDGLNRDQLMAEFEKLADN